MRIQSLPKIFFAVLVFFFSANILQAQVTETEPNNTPAKANVLPLNGSGNGAINPAGDVDWWKVKTNADGQLSIKLTPLAKKTMYARLYDTAGVILLTYSYSDSTFTVNQDGLAAGTYYIQVYSYYPSDINSYIVTNTLTAASVPNDNEPDSNRATALTLPLNSTTTGHVGYYYNNHRDTTDWYKVTTNADGKLNLNITSNSNNGQNLDIYLFDNNGTTLLKFGNFISNGTFTLSTDGLAAGTYYIQIFASYVANGGFAPYTLTDSLFTTGIGNDNEPDSNRATALTLPLNSTTTGHVGYYYNNHRDTTDWYKVILNQDGQLNLYLTSINGQNLNINLLDKNGSTVINYNIFVGSGGSTLSTDGLAAGTYYIQLYGSYPSLFTPYILTDSLFTYSYAADTASEPNGQPYLAKTLPANIITTGHVNFYYNLMRDSTDWWKINYTDTSGNLNLTFNLLPHIIDGSYSDTWFQVYKDTAAAPIYSNNNSSPSTTINLTGLAQGYYYIRIFEFYNNNKQFEAYSITASFTTLPVTFINFNGVLRDNNAYLTWSTATEINNKGFEVEKSIDGQTFTDIGFVKGHRNSSVVNNYNYTDVKGLSSSDYYRLKQIDLDGNFNYSSVIRLDYAKFGWAIVGNPVGSNSWIQLKLDKTSKVAMQVISLNGSILQTIDKETISAGTYSIPLNLARASAGMYVVRLIVDNNIYSKKINK